MSVLESSWDPGEATPEPDGGPDEAVVPYVEALLWSGVKTLQSCSGHVHEDGSRTDGHLVWIDEGRFDPPDLPPHRFHTVRKEHRRYQEPAWEVSFRGLASETDDPEVSLRRDMGALFGALGVEVPR